MLPGYNHNLNVDGVVFHVQTEDRETNSARYIETQVFVEGAIIHVEKNSYPANNVGNNRDEIIGLMQNQHKSVLKKLSQKLIPGMERYLRS
ncbi:MAG TPA: hypothetical protein PKC21_04450 [Oligoflexia bacterium]|nr:hypothetical protein [Oligoflexia bacterium]HMR24588.1 hypothetical protein [Oligoflexia bacterium]